MTPVYCILIVDDDREIRELLYKLFTAEGYQCAEAANGEEMYARLAEQQSADPELLALSADILGDWREEVIWRTSDNTELRIFTTPIPTATPAEASNESRIGGRPPWSPGMPSAPISTRSITVPCCPRRAAMPARTERNPRPRRKQPSTRERLPKRSARRSTTQTCRGCWRQCRATTPCSTSTATTTCTAGAATTT